jgi:UPF0042 nucleotide-binding protein
MKAVLITGMLASGKSIALRVFQDMGYYCIDNLPPALIKNFVELAKHSEASADHIALVIDVRVDNYIKDVNDAIKYLKENTDFKILFIDARTDVLISRYKESKRRHLMFDNERIEDTIWRERQQLGHLREMADFIIDTSDIREAEFKQRMVSIFGPDEEFKSIIINVASFGFKYGILRDADLVFDVRFLPNPYYIEEMRELSGHDEAVCNYIMGFEESRLFIDKIGDLLRFMIPLYIKEGKKQLIIGIGCTGGRHRSVCMAEKISEKITQAGYDNSVEHRDIKKDEYI